MDKNKKEAIKQTVLSSADWLINYAMGKTLTYEMIQKYKDDMLKYVI